MLKIMVFSSPDVGRPKASETMAWWGHRDALVWLLGPAAIGHSTQDRRTTTGNPSGKCVVCDQGALLFPSQATRSPSSMTHNLPWDLHPRQGGDGHAGPASPGNPARHLGLGHPCGPGARAWHRTTAALAFCGEGTKSLACIFPKGKHTKYMTHSWCPF